MGGGSRRFEEFPGRIRAGGLQGGRPGADGTGHWQGIGAGGRVDGGLREGTEARSGALGVGAVCWRGRKG